MTILDTGKRTPQEVMENKQKFMTPAVGHYYENPPLMVKGEMQYLYDSEGKQYLDLFAGVVTVNSGHCHPKIADRIVEQVRTLQHTTTLYLTTPMVDLAKKLAEITPGKLQKSFICNSGTEATEGAALMTKAYTKSHDFIALRNSFHGRSIMAMSMTGQYNWRIGGPYVFGVNFIPSAYCYRCPHGQTYPSCDMVCATDLENVIKTCTPGRIAALFAEPIQGNGGVVVPPPEYFKIIAEIVRKYGGLFIADEVQTGFGRTGGRMFGIEHWGVEPDIMTMAKGFGNGLAIGAFIARPEIADSLGPMQHFSTYGGNPISCTGALANIENIVDEKLADNAASVGEYFMDKLRELQEKHPLIGDVRGKGLMIGVELVRENKVPATAEMKRLMETCLKKGVLIGKGGLDGNVIRIKPPLCITKANVDHGIKILDEAMTEIERGV
jgi:4-aminobutyrate aminotransferase / (S)-3-amino-2-methylpropionate transaminase / 5-aminovalerate transaminase